MRDIALTAIIFGLLPVILARPYVGAYMWAWVSMMIPHRLTFGFAYFFPFAQIIAIVTLLATAFSRQRQPIPWHPITVLLVLFVLWMSVTSLFALAPTVEVFDTWLRVIKIHVMLIVTMMLVRGRQKIDWLIWVMVLSIGFYGVKGGIWVVLTGGGERVYGPPGGVIANNNELALALVMLLPLMYYLTTTAGKKWIRLGLIGAMICVCFSILGSHSRGAFMALGTMALFLALKSHRPVLMVILLGVLGAIAIPFMPDHWTGRMESITTHEDWSAMSRIYTWQMIWNLALDHPFVGGGFDFNSPYIVDRYSPVEMKAYSPHSIYFQALGEHGFVGLIIYVALLLCSWFSAGRLARVSKNHEELVWVVRLMPMIQTSIAGFMVGGAFLNLVHFDFPYYLLALVVLAHVETSKQLALSPKPPGKTARGGRLSPSWSR
jgi:putative inorganic carbon (HCO3(-)) transporter